MIAAKTLRKRIKDHNLVLDVSTEAAGFSWIVKLSSSGKSISCGAADCEEAAKADAEAAAIRHMGGSGVREYGWYSVIQ